MFRETSVQSFVYELLVIFHVPFRYIKVVLHFCCPLSLCVSEDSDVRQFRKWFSAVEFCVRHLVVCYMLNGIMYPLTQAIITCIKNTQVMTCFSL